MIFLLFLFTINGQRQVSPLQELYEEGKYFAVIEQAEKALKDTTLSVQDEVGIHTVLAFCYVALDKENLAKLEFLEALALDPKLELDPILTSPKIMKIFQEAKSTFHFFPRGETIVPQDKKRVVDFMVPGLWDIRNDNKKIGYFLLGWSSASLLSIGVSHYLCNKYHQEYLAARDEATINHKYRIYSFWYLSRWYSLGSLVLTYAFNLFSLK